MLIAEQLGDQAGIAGLGAACAGAGELQQGLRELAALDGLVTASSSFSVTLSTQ